MKTIDDYKKYSSTDLGVSFLEIQEKLGLKFCEDSCKHPWPFITSNLKEIYHSHEIENDRLIKLQFNLGKKLNNISMVILKTIGQSRDRKFNIQIYYDESLVTSFEDRYLDELVK